MTQPPAPPPADGERRPDLRLGVHHDAGVEVRRELIGEGHLARGSHTRASRISFSSRSLPAGAAARKPLSAQQREAPPAAAAADAGAGDATLHLPAEPAPAGAPDGAAPPGGAKPGLLGRLGRWLSRS